MPKPRVIRKKRVVRRKATIQRSLVSKGLKTYKFARMSLPTYIVTSASPGTPVIYQGAEGTMGAIVAAGAPFGTNNVGFGLGFIFKLFHVHNHTEFTNLFDSFRVIGIQAKVDYMSSNQGGAPAYQTLPDLNYCHDYDDGTPPPTQVTVQQYQGSRCFKLTAERTKTIYFKPKVLNTVYAGPLFTAYSNPMNAPWCDCTSPEIEFYGLKMYIDNYNANLNGMPPIRIQFKYYLEFKTVR